MQIEMPLQYCSVSESYPETLNDSEFGIQSVEQSRWGEHQRNVYSARSTVQTALLLLLPRDADALQRRVPLRGLAVV